MEWNTLEKAIKTETQEQNKKEWASSAGLCQRRKPQHPHHVKGEPDNITVISLYEDENDYDNKCDDNDGNNAHDFDYDE